MAVFAISCGPKPTQPLGWLDTPEHHTVIGIRLLEQDKCADAGREFDLALKLDPQYAKAAAGAGLVKACRGDFAGAQELLDRAKRYAHSDKELLFALAGQIQVTALSHAGCLKIGTECPQDNGWLREAEGTFERALRIDPTSAAAHYYMGECYLTALDLEAAGRMFSRVLDINRGYVGQADARWKLVQKVQRAMPATTTGKKLALAERITRADATALFVAELKLDDYYSRWKRKRSNGGFEDRLSERQATGQPLASDVTGHPLRPEIEKIIRIGIRGLDLFPDGTFRPDEQVDRVGYAVMIADIFSRITGDNSLDRRFTGSRSPFPDLRVDDPGFNAVMVATSRGIMEAVATGTGAFGPYEPVGGVDALFAIRRMREELR